MSPDAELRLRTGCPNVVNRSIDCTLIDIRHRHLCAFTRERGRDGAPEPSSSSENKRRLPFQPEIHTRLLITTSVATNVSAACVSRGERSSTTARHNRNELCGIA